MGKPDHELKLGQYHLEIAAYAQKWMEIPLSFTIPENIDFLRVEAARSRRYPVAFNKLDC